MMSKGRYGESASEFLLKHFPEMGFFLKKDEDAGIEPLEETETSSNPFSLPNTFFKTQSFFFLNPRGKTRSHPVCSTIRELTGPHNHLEKFSPSPNLRRVAPWAS
jgi:hypothetical protein